MLLLGNIGNLFLKTLSLWQAFFIMLGSLAGGGAITDTQQRYIEKIKAIDFYQNTLETAIPQTELYSVIKNHFNSPLPEGKTEKKCIVIGYDGGRADVLGDLSDTGAVKYLKDNGEAYISYAGGVNFPAKNVQFTSTAPGWCSILTGQWASVTGISENGIVKSDSAPKTLLLSLVEDKVIDKSAFYVSWDGHFISDDSTYKNEYNYIESKGLNVKYKDAVTDVDTFTNVEFDVSSCECSDFIFTIIETPDSTGHSSGFASDSPKYQYGVKICDTTARLIIDTIESRCSYDTEDWLIILTSDHGGFETNHGSSTIQERMTFIVSNKKLGLS